MAIVPLDGQTAGSPGAFNSQILRRAIAFERELRPRASRSAGWASGGAESARCASGASSSSGEFTGFTDQPRYADAQAIAHRVAELYTEEEVDRVVVVYNHFESALVQTVTVQDASAALGGPAGDRRRGAIGRCDARRLHLRARARADPGAAAAGLRRDGALPGVAGIGRLGARRPDDRDAKRVEERRGADRQT